MYHKIKAPFVRDPESKRLTNTFLTNEFAYLCNNNWIWTEKIDGMNIRIIWDGHKVSFAGRTDRAEIPLPLMEVLEHHFGGEENETLFEQKFDVPTILYGEGFGGKIQKKAGYGEEYQFALFDVNVNGTWLERISVEDIANYFKIPIAPVKIVGGIGEAIGFVQAQPKSTFGDTVIEGLVGRPVCEMKNKLGERIITKVKVSDFVQKGKNDDC